MISFVHYWIFPYFVFRCDRPSVVQFASTSPCGRPFPLLSSSFSWQSCHQCFPKVRQYVCMYTYIVKYYTKFYTVYIILLISKNASCQHQNSKGGVSGVRLCDIISTHHHVGDDFFSKGKKIPARSGFFYLFVNCQRYFWLHFGNENTIWL